MPSALEIHSLIQFLNESITPFHAVEECRKTLKNANFTELDETKPWILDPGHNYFVVRGQASLFAFRTPQRFTPDTRLHLIGAHTDSPSLRLKPNPSAFRDGYHLLNVEVYGSPILSTWFDRDLSFGGILIYRQKTSRELCTRLVRSDTIQRIPSLAVHLDDPANPTKINAQSHLMPVLGLGGGDMSLTQYLESMLNPGEELVDFDLQFFDVQGASQAGFSNEFIVSGRIDNLAMAHASLRALVECPNSHNHLVGITLFHNEEVGSVSWQGAESRFVPQVLDRIFNAFQASRDLYYTVLAQSLLISADMAHAVHPAFEDRHDPHHRPRINNGPVLKTNANRRYATEAMTSAKFREICRIANISIQNFCSRNDQRCGSTIGPAMASQLGIPTVDVGNPMLSMHSIREMAGCEDHDSMIRVFKTFFSQD